MSYRILIADDARINRVLIKKILSQSIKALEFEEADNGKDVLRIVKKVQIDLIILDLIMPELDGYQVLQELKSSEQYHDIPIIVNSALADISAIERTLREGAIDYFKKPLSPNDMKVILPLKARNALMLYEQNKMINELNHRIDEELKNAHTFAEIMLPRPSSLHDVELHYKYHPSMAVGGDYFDCTEVDGKTHFIIADVTGHGIAAGMASSMVKMLYRKCIEKPNIKPHEIIEEMNGDIFEIFDFSINKYFIFTAFVGIIENGTLSYANAGQPYPLVYKKDIDAFKCIEQNGFLVGMMDGVEFETLTMPIAKGDALFLYTDGLFCSGDVGDFTDWQKVEKLANQFKLDLEAPDDFLEEIFYAFKVRHMAHNSNFTDDVALTLLIVQ